MLKRLKTSRKLGFEPFEHMFLKLNNNFIYKTSKSFVMRDRGRLSGLLSAITFRLSPKGYEHTGQLRIGQAFSD